MPGESPFNGKETPAQAPASDKGKGFDLFLKRSMLLDGNGGALVDDELSERASEELTQRGKASGSEHFARRASELNGTISDDMKRTLGLADDSARQTSSERRIRSLSGAQLFLKRSQELDGDGNLERELNPDEWAAMLAQSDEWDALKQQRALEAERERHDAMARGAGG